MPSDKGFDGDAYYRALEAVVSSRTKTWKEVADETGVSASTLTRMARGKRPDADSLAALSAWAELNPSDFVRAPYVKAPADSIGRINKCEMGRTSALQVASRGLGNREV